MAKEEERKSTPAFIDYDNVEEDASQSPHSYLQNQWKKLILKHHRANIIWSIKDQTLLSKLIKEFRDRDLISQMMYNWITYKTIVQARNFSYFYVKRYELRDNINGKDYQWD